jgi:tRNA pseudouridine65 synthase
LVHRLDKDTSGLLMVTLKPELQDKLQQAMQAGEKKYLAVLRGVIDVQTDVQTRWQKWDVPLTDGAESRTNPQGLTTQRITACTLYRVEKNNPYFTLVHCLLKTGRQHQIRKHAALAGRPVVGDTRYGNLKDNERIQKRYGFSRLALHAQCLTFKWNQQEINVASPPPAEFDLLFDTKIR